MSKIVRLEASNIKRLSAVEIVPGPDDSLIVIGGENGAGKSSVLDSIAYALGGAEAIPSKPVREGAAFGKIVVETEEYVITRKLPADGGNGTLKITNKEGVAFPSPQALLDTLTSRVCFDPLAFTRMKPEAQAETLRRLVGINFSALDAEHGQKYAERTAINRSIKTQQVSVTRLGPITEAGCEFRDDAALGKRMEAGAAVNAANEKKRGELDDLNDGIVDTESAIARKATDIAAIEAKLSEERKKLTSLQGEREQKIKVRDKCHTEIKALVDVDLAVIRAEMDKASALAAEVSQNIRRRDEGKRLRALESESQALTDRLAAIEDDKAAQLHKTKFPIKGLGFSAGAVTFNGFPLEQASAAEQLRVSVAIGAAMSPALKVALIRDGSLLDDKSLRLVAECAAEHGLQCWMERVGEGAECSIVIEDGMRKDDKL